MIGPEESEPISKISLDNKESTILYRLREKNEGFILHNILMKRFKQVWILIINKKLGWKVRNATNDVNTFESTS